MILEVNVFITHKKALISHVFMSNISLERLIHIGLRKFTLLVFVSFLICSSYHCLCQDNNLSVPMTINYQNDVYNAGTQNWDIQQHPNGFIFFANNNGLLQFDGTNWTIYSLPNKTIARSLLIEESDRIYVGGQGEFGYFQPDQQGKLLFNSLLDRIPIEKRQFTDVWKIVKHQGHIYFSASGTIYDYYEEKISIKHTGRYELIGKAHDRLLLIDENRLAELIDGEIEYLINGETDLFFTDVAEGLHDDLILTSPDDGLFKLSGKSIRPFLSSEKQHTINSKLFCIREIGNDLLAVGTVTEGLVILNKKGDILYRLNKKNGLQNSNIISIFCDREENLWLGLDNGIDYVAMNSPFFKLLADQDLESTSYTANIHQGTLYIGTSTGLYSKEWSEYYNPFSDTQFELINGSQGQVWGLKQVEDVLFLGHHEGGFRIKYQDLDKLSSQQGAWTFLQLKNHPSYMVMGTYHGLQLFEKINDSWVFKHEYTEINESCRLMEQDKEGDLWISHPYRGIYRVKFSTDLMAIDVKLFGKNEGLPSENLNHVFHIQNDVIFTGETGVFTFDREAQTFLHHDQIESLIGKDESIQRLIEDEFGNIWFITRSQTGILSRDVTTQGFTKKIYPELNKKLVRGFEFIYPYDEFNVFIGAEKGMIHFNPSKKTPSIDTTYQPNIINIQSINNGDSIVYGGQYDDAIQKQFTEFSDTENAFRFNYTTTNYSNTKNIQYSTKLEGFDDEWSNWYSKSGKEYTNLKAGKYTFLVKAKTPQQESQIAQYSFSIKPPWYASSQAILLYCLLILLFLAALIFIPQKRFQKEKEIHKQVVAQSEEEITALKNKQLEIEIAHKNRELALTTMHLVQRKELINNLQEPISQILRKTTDKTAIKEIKRVNKLLHEDSTLDENWNHFAYHFDQVHIDFLKKLRAKFPQLTGNDQRLCAYLRMNLSTKEIAPLMNISIRGVETGRYRLRKKLDLDKSIDLSDFMISFSG